MLNKDNEIDARERCDRPHL